MTYVLRKACKEPEKYPKAKKISFKSSSRYRAQSYLSKNIFLSLLSFSSSGFSSSGSVTTMLDEEEEVES